MRNTMRASEVVATMRRLIEQYGDREVFFTDGFSDFGMCLQAESAPNFESPKAFLVKAFSLETGKNVPEAPLAVTPASPPRPELAA